MDKQLIEEDKQIKEAAVKYIETLFQSVAASHDADHTLRVYSNALKIAKKVKGCDIKVVALQLGSQEHLHLVESIKDRLRSQLSIFMINCCFLKMP